MASNVRSFTSGWLPSYRRTSWRTTSTSVGLVVSAAQVLHGRVLEDHYRCRAIFVLRPFIGPGVLGRRDSDRVSCGGQRG